MIDIEDKIGVLTGYGPEFGSSSSAPVAIQDVFSSMVTLNEQEPKSRDLKMMTACLVGADVLRCSKDWDDVVNKVNGYFKMCASFGCHKKSLPKPLLDRLEKIVKDGSFSFVVYCGAQKNFI